MCKASTKQKLLSATLKLISEKGYLGATTREIASQAGVTELTLFRHFGTKEKLFEELLGSYTYLPKLKELLPELGSLPYRDSLKMIAVTFLLSLKERKSMVKIMHSEVTTYPEKVRKLYNNFLDELRSTLAGYFRGLQQRGIMHQKTSPETAAKIFLWILFSYFRTEEIMRGGVGITRKKMKKNVDEIVELFINGTLNPN